MLLNIKIESISLAQPETTLNVDFFAKGIRLDVFVKDDTDRIFDIEMQVIGNVAAGVKLPKNAGEKFPLLGI